MSSMTKMQKAWLLAYDKPWKMNAMLQASFE